MQPELPPALVRYLEAALPPGALPPRSVRLFERGWLRQQPGGKKITLSAREVLTAWPPGAAWRARLRPAPGIRLDVLDTYHDGRGGVEVSLLGWRTIAKMEGAHIDPAALVRWLSGAAFLPGLLPGDEAFTWQEDGPDAARLVLEHRGQRVEGLFVFGPDGLPVRFRTPARWRDLGAQGGAPTPWEVRYLQWREVQGYRVCSRAQAAWLPAGEPEFVYAELNIAAPPEFS